MRTSYLALDGKTTMSVFPYGANLMALADIVDRCQGMSERADFEREAHMKPKPRKGVRLKQFWNVKWIPFTDSGGGGHHCVDMDPAPSGTVGQVIYFSCEDSVQALEAPSFGAWLGAYVKDLEKGRFRFDVEEGCIYPIDDE
jgi:cell wall assembly regulator SMI1